MFILLPNGRKVDIREGKIRQCLGADPGKEIEL
jgi:hypothetical protein